VQVAFAVLEDLDRLLGVINRQVGQALCVRNLWELELNLEKT